MAEDDRSPCQPPPQSVYELISKLLKVEGERQCVGLVEYLNRFSSQDFLNEDPFLPDRPPIIRWCPAFVRLHLTLLHPACPYFSADGEFLKPSINDCPKCLVTAKVPNPTQPRILLWTFIDIFDEILYVQSQRLCTKNKCLLNTFYEKKSEYYAARTART